MATVVAATAAMMFSACNAGDDYFAEPLSGETSHETRAEASVFDNSKSGGVLVLQEGNMTTENGFLNFVGSDGKYYLKVGGERYANVAQDLSLFGNTLYVVCQNYPKGNGPGAIVTVDAADFTVKNRYRTPDSVINPTHIAVAAANRIYVRSSGPNYRGQFVYCFNGAADTAPTRLSLSDDDDPTIASSTSPSAKPAATPMVVANGYLYICSNKGLAVYKTSTNTRIGVVGAGSSFKGVIEGDGKVYAYTNGKLYTITPTNDSAAVDGSNTKSVTLNFSTYSNSAQMSYYNGCIFYATSGGAVYKYALTGTTPSLLGSIFTGAAADAGSIMYNGVAVDPSTGYLYVGSTVYGNTDNKNFSNTCALQVFDVNSSFERVKTFQGDERFTAGIFFWDNFDTSLSAPKSFDYVTSDRLEKYDPDQFYD